jgi:hypothetical protein
MPFGLTNAPRTFQKAMRELFDSLPLVKVDPYDGNYFGIDKKFYLITFTEVFSRFTKIFKINHIDSHTVANVFKKYLKMGYDPPIHILTDNGTQYHSKLFRKVCEDFEIKQKFTCPNTPTSNSISERINATINLILRIFKNKISVNQAIKKAEFRLNHTYNRSLGDVPMRVCFGKDELLNETFEKPDYDDLYNTMKLEKQNDLKKINAKRDCTQEIKIGDLIMVKRKPADKLDDLWEGPFNVIEVAKAGNKLKVDRESCIEWHSLRNLRLWRGIEYCVACSV